MVKIIVGIDIAKNVFQVHAADEDRSHGLHEETEPWTGSAVLRQTRPCVNRHGGVRHVALLGARIDKTWS